MSETRDFVDAAGVRWEVRAALAGNGDAFCLRFESPGEVRESCPAPDAWESLDETELRRLCERGTVSRE